LSGAVLAPAAIPSSVARGAVKPQHRGYRAPYPSRDFTSLKVKDILENYKRANQ
jgi:hypothetical protein